MTETRIASYSDYVTKSREKSTSPGTSERDRLISQLEPGARDERDLTEMLAQLAMARAIENRRLWSEQKELKAALDRAKQRELTILGWLQERDAWAKAWKRAAKFNRRGWLADLVDGMPRDWRRRRRTLLEPLWWTR